LEVKSANGMAFTPLPDPSCDRFKKYTFNISEKIDLGSAYTYVELSRFAESGLTICS
jgi:hypothetical protein